MMTAADVSRSFTPEAGEPFTWVISANTRTLSILAGDPNETATASGIVFVEAGFTVTVADSGDACIPGGGNTVILTRIDASIATFVMVMVP